MQKLIFRTLRASEIDCRISTASQKGVSLLLYKDARVDQNILDETVGPMNWQRSHSRDNANCTVSLWDEEKQQWIAKEDTGTESNTEKEKGLASDSFKRACFNWGIGRELYTAPFIWIKAVVSCTRPRLSGLLPEIARLLNLEELTNMENLFLRAMTNLRFLALPMTQTETLSTWLLSTRKERRYFQSTGWMRTAINQTIRRC